MRKSEYLARKLAELDFLLLPSEEASDRMFYLSKEAAYRRRLDQLDRRLRGGAERATA